MIFKNYPFFPFLAPFTQTVGATTPKINTNLPFMVTNIISKFHNNPSTTTQVIGRKPNFYRRRRRRRLRHNIIRPQNFFAVVCRTDDGRQTDDDGRKVMTKAHIAFGKVS